MTDKNVIDRVFKMSSAASTPKYRQIMDSVLKGIEQGKIGKGTHLPSINEVCVKHSLARETVNKAYKHLKQKGVVSSLPGKGFFVTTNHYAKKVNVFVLFDVLQAPYKENLYEGIKKGLRGKATLDFYFHHYNPEVFCKLLQDSIGKYEYYVVMPIPNAKVRNTLSSFDQDKLLLLDIDVSYPRRNCAIIRQSHDEELERALETGLKKIRRYKSFTLVFPKNRNCPVVIKKAFGRFCKKHGLEWNILPSLNENNINQDSAYLVIEDDDLVNIVKYCKAHRLQAGKDIGFISYNDTSFKEIIEGGVSVVSIDFYAMGQRTAEQILRREKINFLQPTELILRSSL
ncbi:MAG: GntR family transcriptional regulator [Sedimentisphaerales bacterium]|nr:GntR family transcriptional regulator [Sedimentisphaerales bacterium]